MAQKQVLRRNQQALRWLSAAAFAFVTGAALSVMSFEPSSVAFALALAVGVTSLFSPGIAVLTAVVAMSLPVLAADFLTGAAFLIVGFATVQYLGQQGGRAFLIIALAFVGALFGPVWAAVIIAGYLLGASEGAVAAVIACLALEGVGVVMGREYVGIVFTGGVETLVSFVDAPANLLGFGWLSEALDSIDPGALLGAFTATQSKVMLVVQPMLWGVGAAIAGGIRRPLDDPKRPLYGLAAAGISAVWMAASAMLIQPLVDNPLSAGSLIWPAIASLTVAAILILAWEYIFPLTQRTSPVRVRPGTMSSEDADVDELLRLIAAAEDQLASKHTVKTVVMITDMKSFSKMTEEEGSFTSAKTIQRHRDLLLPVVAAHQGKGKSTGGDGLVASFPTAPDALSAAVEMQQTLETYNTQHPSERDIIVRCGIASGEVVLDKGGRPFIGTALNLAARIMNLGDGGQVLTTRKVAEGGSDAGAATHSHGMFSLKNIAGATEVLEVFWHDGQKPVDPQGSRLAAPEEA